MADTVVNLNLSLDPARGEALRIADQLVAEWTAQVKNERGYVHDRWQPVDITKRTAAVLQIAEWLMQKPMLLKAPPPSARLWGWDPAQGAPHADIYQLALEQRRLAQSGHTAIPPAGVDLINQAISMYEAARAGEESPS